MAWFLGQSLVFLALAFLLGLLAGWLAWGRRSGSSRSSRVDASLRTFFPEAPGATVHQAVRRPVREPVRTPGRKPSRTPARTPEPAQQADPAVPPRPAPEAHIPAAPALPVPSAPVIPAPAEAQPVDTDLGAPEPGVDPADAETSDAETTGAETTGAETAGADPGQPADAEAEGAPGDDLQRIEGIGPKISTVLRGSGVRTYRQLADLDRLQLTEILSTGGVKFAPSLATWGEQARLLARGDESGFADLTSRLVADRRGH